MAALGGGARGRGVCLPLTGLHAYAQTLLEHLSFRQQVSHCAVQASESPESKPLSSMTPNRRLGNSSADPWFT